MSSSPKIGRSYGTVNNVKHNSYAQDIYGTEEDGITDETSLLLQWKMERAGAEVKGVSMVDVSPSRGMPETYCSMNDLTATRDDNSLSKDGGITNILDHISE